MKNSFLIFKKEKLSGLKIHDDAGKVDNAIKPLLFQLNSREGFVTSSSCAGRTALLEILESKKDARFYKLYHGFWKKGSLSNLVQAYSGKRLYWNTEPFILHVFCKDLSWAEKLLKACRASGIRRFGLQHLSPFPFVEIMGSSYIAVPVFDKKLLVNKATLEYLECESKKKMLANNKSRQRLLATLKSLD